MTIDEFEKRVEETITDTNPVRVDEIKSLVRAEKLKLLNEVRSRAKEMYTPALSVRAASISEIDKLEAEL